MLNRRMRLSGISSAEQFRHPLLPSFRWPLHGVLQRFVKGNGVGQGCRIPHHRPQVPEVMHALSRHQHQDPLGPQAFQRATERVVGVWILGREQGDLDDGDVQRVICGAEKDLEGEPDAVVEAPRDGSGGHAVRLQEGNDLEGYCFAADVGVLFFVVLRWKAVEAIYISMLCARSAPMHVCTYLILLPVVAT